MRIRIFVGVDGLGVVATPENGKAFRVGPVRGAQIRAPSGAAANQEVGLAFRSGGRRHATGEGAAVSGACVGEVAVWHGCGVEGVSWVNKFIAKSDCNHQPDRQLGSVATMESRKVVAGGHAEIQRPQ